MAYAAGMLMVDVGRTHVDACISSATKMNDLPTGDIKIVVLRFKHLVSNSGPPWLRFNRLFLF